MCNTTARVGKSPTRPEVTLRKNVTRSAATLPRGPRRRGLSKSATKAPIAPELRERIVDIPCFFPRPIPSRDAFVADLDTPPTRTADYGDRKSVV